MTIQMVIGIVTVVGLLIYAFTDGRPAEAGRIAFAVGLLAFLLRF